MASTAGELEQVFDGCVPRQVQEALIRCLFGAYKTTFEECARFPEEEARDLRPFYRWVQLRTDLRGIAQRFRGVGATAERYHTLLAAGRVILTASAVEGPGDLVRPALYRQTYASSSQLDLFIKDTPPPDDAQLYAILLHGPDPTEPRQPLFAQIAFPDKACQSYVHEIDLFSRFSALVESLRIPQEEAEGQEPLVQLHTEARTKRES